MMRDKEKTKIQFKKQLDILVRMFIFVISVLGLAYYITYCQSVLPVNAAQFNITLDSPFTEYEAEFTALLVANCTDELGDCHENNVTFTITGINFVYSNETGLYYGTVTQNTPQTIEYGVLGVFADTENITSAGFVVQNVTITWTTGTLDRLQTKFMAGDWIGAIFDEEAYVVGTMTLYTFILGTFSIGIWNYSGPYGALLTWLLGWGIFSTQVHGAAQSMALLLFALSFGIMIAKLYLDRRTT